MNIIRSIDEKLMRLLTYNWRYRDLDNRPQTRIVIVSTLIPTLMTIDVMTSGFSPLNTMGILYWLPAFYEWRLWYRLRKRRAKRDK